MAQAMPRHRQQIPPTVPRISVFFIPGAGIGKVLGPGGKMKRCIMEEFGLSEFNLMDTPSGDGRISISSFDETRLAQCKLHIEDMIGETSPARRAYEGRLITRVLDWLSFFLPTTFSQVHFPSSERFLLKCQSCL
jgi:polyribonucleotide nucleotidyltransferase